MVLRLLPWAMWVAMLVFSVATYSALPAEIPQHMNLAGEVTRTARTTWLSWMVVPIIAGATQALLTGLTLLLPSRPDLFNFSDKERFLKLPPAHRGDVIPRMQQTLDVFGALSMLVMASVQVMMWRAALGHPTKNAVPFLLIGTVIFVPLAVWLTSRVSAAVEESYKRWRATTGGMGSKTSDPR